MEETVAEEEQSLITDEHRALIGKRNEPLRVRVKEEDAHRMRDILEDKDPRWVDGATEGPPYVIAAFGARPGNMPFIFPRGLLTQQEWKFNRPFVLGEELDAVTYVADIRERLGGRYGHTVLVTMTTEYYDMSGQQVGATLSTLTQFDPTREQKGESAS
jgi:hypothetical protein